MADTNKMYLKNSNLRVLLNGKIPYTYDGTKSVEVDINPNRIGAAYATHTHKTTDITDIPSKLPNPTSLVVKLNNGSTEGSNMFTYTGSAAKSINITPASIGAAAASHTHNYIQPSNSTDLDYVIGGSTTYSAKLDDGYKHGPSEAIGGAGVVVYYAGSRMHQILTDDTGKVFKRYSNYKESANVGDGDYWSPWQLLNDPVEELPSTCDLNDYYYTKWGTMRKYRGLFGSSSGNSISNSPSNNFTGSAGFINDTYLWTYPCYMFTGSKTLATIQILSINGSFYKRIGYHTGNSMSWIAWDQIVTKSQIQNLTSDSGWLNVTTSSDFPAYNSGTIPKIRKIGNIVELRGVVKNKNAFVSNGSVLTDIPSNMRPSQNVYVVQTANSQNMQMIIKTDGTIGLERCGSGTVAADAWITVCATWFVG